MASATVLPPPAALKGTAAIADETGLVDYQPSSKVVKNLETKSVQESPVETFVNEKQVPSEFVSKEPTSTPIGWGNAEESHDPEFQLPLIDMAPLIAKGTTDKDKRGDIDEEAAKKVVDQIGRACEEWGFFQVVNHGIPENLLDRVMKAAREFFTLPVEEKQKQKCATAGQFKGYGRHDMKAGTRQWQDCLRFTVRPKSAMETDMMPENPPNYRPMIDEYSEAVEKLFYVLGTAMSEYLGLESEALINKAYLGDTPHMFVRVNYYPPCPEPEKVFGLRGHKDIGTFTALAQDGVGGLQIQKKGTDIWVDAQPVKGGLVINIANQVEIVSNGKFISSMHRAVVHKNTARISMAAFASPGPKGIIRPMQELLDKTGDLPKYREVIFEDYLPNMVDDFKKEIPPHIRYLINRE